jgi:hypothetical protein
MPDMRTLDDTALCLRLPMRSEKSILRRSKHGSQQLKARLLFVLDQFKGGNDSLLTTTAMAGHGSKVPSVWRPTLE